MPYLRVNNELPLIPGYASGNIVSFSDGYPGAALNMLKVSVKGSQSGSGDPSPDNVRPITAYSQAVITQSDGDDTVIETRTASFVQTLYEADTDLLAGTGNVKKIAVNLGDLSYTYEDPQSIGQAFGVMRATLAQKPKVNGIILCEIFKGIQTGLGSLLNNQCCISGTVAYPFLRIRCDEYTDASLFKTAVTGKKLAYESASTVPITFTPIPDITNLSGPNIIQADCGPIELNYIRRLDS